MIGWIRFAITAVLIIAGLLFFISAVVASLFLTVRVLQMRRWS
jgi:hypothetical protein